MNRVNKTIIGRMVSAAMAALVPLAFYSEYLIADGTISLSLSTQTPTVSPGDIINIALNCDVFDSISEFGPIDIEYDETLFEFVSVTSADVLSGYTTVTDNDDQGSITIESTFVPEIDEETGNEVQPFNAEVQTMLFQIALRARPDASGSTTVRIDSTGSFHRLDGSVVYPYESESLTVMIDAGVSTDATLSSLSLEGITMTPPFDPPVFEYSATVSRDVESVTVNAESTNLHATISVEGNEWLDTGENVVSIHVLAQDGIRWHEYRIFVNRQESYIPEGSGFVDAYGVTYTFLTFPANINLPEGFLQTTKSINGYTVPVFAKDGVASVLVYVYNGTDDPSFYFYNPVTGIASPYAPGTTVVTVGQVLTAESIPSNVSVPAGFREDTVVIDGVEMSGFTNSDGTFISYFRDDSGNYGFYMYDSSSGRFYLMKTVERSSERVYRDLFYVFLITSVIQSIIIVIAVYVVLRVINNRTNPRPKRV